MDKITRNESNIVIKIENIEIKDKIKLICKDDSENTFKLYSSSQEIISSYNQTKNKHNKVD